MTRPCNAAVLVALVGLTIPITTTITITITITTITITITTITVTGSAITLARRGEPDSGVAGIIISSISISFMFFLWYAKMHAAIILDSRALEADASCSFGCITLSFVLLLGSGAYPKPRHHSGSNHHSWSDLGAGLQLCTAEARAVC